MRIILLVLITVLLHACAVQQKRDLSSPAVEYSKQLKGSQNIVPVAAAGAVPNIRFADLPRVLNSDRDPTILADGFEQPRAAFDGSIPNNDDFRTAQTAYNGPLSLGDPGVSASLWRESSNNSDFYRDNRAWKPMDLITIIISESAQGKKEAGTETTSESTVLAAINNLLTIDSFGGGATPSALIKASTTNDFTGDGKTDRKDTLKATISAMVVEVLPSGIVRVEGKKIISVNNEDQTLILSGLVRPRDISSDNQVESSRIANMRVDYFGTGIISEKQSPGWISRLVSIVWPF